MAAAALVLAATAQPLAEARTPQAVALRRLAGQSIMTGFSGTTVPASLLQRVRLGEVGGIILFGGNVRSQAQVAALARQLQAAAKAGGNPPLLIATDQEGGEVRRFPSGPPVLSGEAMGSRGQAYVRGQGVATGRYLHAAGVNVDLAPRLGRAEQPNQLFGWPRVRPPARPGRGADQRLCARACSRPTWPRRPSTSRASGRRPRTPTCTPSASPPTRRTWTAGCCRSGAPSTTA